jgi:regulatory protein
MKIERCVYGKKTVAVTADGKEYVFTPGIAAKAKFAADKDVPSEEFYRLADESDYALCKDYLFSQIMRYAKTERGYKDKLFDKGFYGKSIAKALAYAVENGYIDDRGFAENYFENNRKKKGARRIIAELRAKGVSDENLAFLHEEKTDTDTVFSLAVKFMKSREKSPDVKIKLIRHLLTKGFSFDEINPVVGKIFADD